MTFLSEDNRVREAAALGLSQRGRAGVEFLGAVQNFSSGFVRARAREDFAADPDGAQLLETRLETAPAVDWTARNARTREIAERYASYRFERFYQRFVAEQQWIRGILAVEERRPQFESYVNATLPPAGGTLELDPDLAVPDYYRGVQWHLQPGGWEGHDLYGPMFTHVCGPMVFRHGGYAAVEQGDDIVGQRIQVLKQLPKSQYGTIYEPGCGGGSTLACAHGIHPSARLMGCDISAELLETADQSARRLRIPMHLKQRDARRTREPDASVDAVVMFALLHEMPVDVADACLAEAFRILRPGGDIVISDPPPFAAVDPLQAAILDWDTVHREEPYFSAACEQDWGAHLGAVGFARVRSFSLGRYGYPYVSVASKPA